MSAAIVNPGTETVVPSSPVSPPAQEENTGGNAVTIEDARAQLAQWDVPIEELEKFTDDKGAYRTLVGNISKMEAKDITVASNLVLNSRDYLALVKKERRFSRFNSIGYEQEMDKLIEQYQLRKNYSDLVKFAKEKADEVFMMKLFEPRPDWEDIKGAEREMSRKLDDLIHDTYNNEGFPRLLSKLRELLAFSEANPKRDAKDVPVFDSNSEDSDSDFKTKSKPMSEEVKIVGDSLFGDYSLEDTIHGLTDCVHLFVAHFRHNTWRYSKLNFKSDEESSETKDEDKKRSGWAILDRFLKQDVEKNGEAPGQLEFLYKSADMAARLEKISREQLSALETLDDANIAEAFACIKKAREYFGIY